ncbi:MAG: hypothetical protein ACTSYQ_05100, partial [Candidatus Odinarchaeia archaeon]
MDSFLFNNIIQSLLRSIHKFSKYFLKNYDIDLKISKFPRKKFSININDLKINIIVGKAKILWEYPLSVKLTDLNNYTIIIEKNYFSLKNLKELYRLSMVQGFKADKIEELMKYFSESIILLIFFRYLSKYGPAEERYNNEYYKKVLILSDKWVGFTADNVRKLADLIKFIGNPLFKDYTDREPVREGIAQGIVLKSLQPDKIGDVESLKRILKQ